MTGLYAEEISAYCKHKTIHDENLLLEGLYSIYVRNTQKKGSLVVKLVPVFWALLFH